MLFYFRFAMERGKGVLGVESINLGIFHLCICVFWLRAACGIMEMHVT